MTAQERLAALFVWTGVVLFTSLLFLGSGFWKALLISVFVMISCVVGLGRRRLLQASFAVSVLAVAVVLGFPPPHEWAVLAKTLWLELGSSRIALH